MRNTIRKPKSVKRPATITRRLDLLNTRCLFPCVMRSADVKQGRMVAVLATESGVLRNDDVFGKPVPEYLVMSGFQSRPGNHAVPLLATTDTTSVRNIIGSVRNIQVDGNELLGVLYFASDAKSQEIERKVRSGQLSQLELRTQPVDGYRLNRDQTFMGFDGPCNVVTAWHALSVAFTKKGSDTLARVRL